VGGLCGYVDPQSANFLMDEFFVLRQYRRRGVANGRRVALQSISGTWEVGEIPENVDAQHFWRTVIDRYTGAITEKSA